MNFDPTTLKIIGAIIVALIGAGSFLAFKISKKKNSDNKTNITQNNNAVTNGDIVGGNKTHR